MTYAMPPHLMAAHMQLPPHLYSLQSLGYHAQQAQYMAFHHPMHALRPTPSGNQPLPARTTAKTISPRLTDPKGMPIAMVHQQQLQQQQQRERERKQKEDQEKQQLEKQGRQAGQPITNVRMNSEGKPCDVPLISSLSAAHRVLTPFLQPQSPPLLRPNLTPSNHKLIAPHRGSDFIKIEAQPLQTANETRFPEFIKRPPSRDVQVEVMMPSESKPPLGRTSGSESPNAGSAARVVAGAAVAAASGEKISTSPNFMRIYGFFAALFDPGKESKMTGMIDVADLSTLDSEIIKLLVKNLEVNIGSAVFRQQLSDTCQQQEMRLQELQRQEE